MGVKSFSAIGRSSNRLISGVLPVPFAAAYCLLTGSMMTSKSKPTAHSGRLMWQSLFFDFIISRIACMTFLHSSFYYPNSSGFNKVKQKIRKEVRGRRTASGPEGPTPRREDRSQGSGIRGRRTEERGRRLDVGGRRSGDGGRGTDVRDQGSEVRGQKSEGGGRRAET